MLGRRIQEHGSTCWLINTGWTGGGFGIGSRISIKYTRRMVHAALGDRFQQVEFETNPISVFPSPGNVQEFRRSSEPHSYVKDKEAYERQAEDLRNRFRTNFKQFESQVDPELLALI
jgi:phosphoenolpyruvate carboxykinase (ATP)